MVNTTNEKRGKKKVNVRTTITIDEQQAHNIHLYYVFLSEKSKKKLNAKRVREKGIQSRKISFLLNRPSLKLIQQNKFKTL